MFIEPFLKGSESRIDLPSVAGAGTFVQIVTARLTQTLAILLAKKSEGKLKDQIIEKILVKHDKAVLGDQKIVESLLGQISEL